MSIIDLAVENNYSYQGFLSECFLDQLGGGVAAWRFFFT
jgi:hypothetical protein